MRTQIGGVVVVINNGIECVLFGSVVGWLCETQLGVNLRFYPKYVGLE